MAGQGKTRAVLFSLLLHVGLLAALALMALPCARFEAFFDATGLPEWLNPVECRKPLVMPGPVIQASLVGVAAAPRAERRTAPPPPPPSKPEPTPEPPVKTLPPPPDKPAVQDQAKVVEQAANPTEAAQQAQEEKQRQRQAELEAEQLLAKLDALKRKAAAAERKSDREAQRLEQLADLAKVQEDNDQVPEAEQARAGAGGESDSLEAKYVAALTRTITRNWLRPDDIPPGVVCPIRITQIPGGEVIAVDVLAACPFDSSGRRSVKNAVLRAQPLPYRGFEQVFARTLTLNFKVTE